MKSQNFSASRLKYARVKQGLSIAQLSKVISISSRTLSKYENNHEKPATETIHKLAKKLHMPYAFFFQADLADLILHDISFRSVARKSAKQKDKAYCDNQLAIWLYNWMSARFSLPKSSIPYYKDIPPKQAAKKIRTDWKLGNKSISNMLHLLEAKGVNVFSISEDNKAIDTYSFIYKNRAYIFLNRFKSAEQCRFDLAHELAHLLLHKGTGAMGKNKEKQADEFAFYLLMPEETVQEKAPETVNFEDLIALKAQWKTSAELLLQQWQNLNVVSEWTYRSLQTELNKKGYLIREPNSIPHENSQILDKVLKALWQEKITKQDIANDLNVYIQDIDAIMFGEKLNQKRKKTRS